MTPIDELAAWASETNALWGVDRCTVDGRWMYCAWTGNSLTMVAMATNHQEAARLLLKKVREA